MVTVYALINPIGRIYVGQTLDVDKRLGDHNSGRVFSTKPYRPWEVLFRESVSDRKVAREREKYYKHGVGKEFLKRIADVAQLVEQLHGKE